MSNAEKIGLRGPSSPELGTKLDWFCSVLYTMDQKEKDQNTGPLS